jgi:heptosyltransferase-3
MALPFPGSPLLPRLPTGARIVVLRLRSLGDTLLTTPALRALKAWRPDLELSVLVEKRFADVLVGNPDVAERIEYDRPASLPEVVARLRRLRPALTVNVHGGTLSALLTLMSGARWRAGRTHYRLRFAYYVLCPEPHLVLGRRRMHTVEDRLTTFYALGLPMGEVPPLQIFPQRGARQAVRERLARLNVPGDARYAVLHVTTTFFTKEWPAERFAALGGWLAREHDLVPVFTCGPGERGRIGRALPAGPGVLFSPPTVSELIALIEGATLYVGNDSGPTHIAAALHRPMVVLFGSSDSVAWSPWRAAHERVQNDFPCNPCPGDRCYAFDEPRCILSLTLEQVQQAVERALRVAPVLVQSELA